MKHLRDMTEVEISVRLTALGRCLRKVFPSTASHLLLLIDEDGVAQITSNLSIDDVTSALRQAADTLDSGNAVDLGEDVL